MRRTLDPKADKVRRRLSKLEGVLTPPFEEGAIRLRDGRELAFALFGEPGGHAVMWFHGTPGARRQLPPDAAAYAAEKGLMLIGVDRPGVGDSSVHNERTLLSWARDIEELANALDVDRFAAVGLSGGGPHVLSVAHELADRVTCGNLLGGMAPLAGPEVAPGVPAIVGKAMNAVHRFRGPLGNATSKVVRAARPFATTAAFSLVSRIVPENDRGIMDDKRMRAMFLTDMVSGSQRGFRAQVHDLAANGQEWGFSLRNVDVPMRLWWGGEDGFVPLSHARHMADLMPRSELTVYEGEGHFAGFMRPKEILDWVHTHAN